MILLNDFIAVGYALNSFSEEDFIVLNEGRKVSGKPIACLGAGTGLGETYLTWNGQSYDVWDSEVTLASCLCFICFDFFSRADIQIMLPKMNWSLSSRNILKGF